MRSLFVYCSVPLERISGCEGVDCYGGEGDKGSCCFSHPDVEQNISIREDICLSTEVNLFG